jgi:hypothetical protein
MNHRQRSITLPAGALWALIAALASSPGGAAEQSGPPNAQASQPQGTAPCQNLTTHDARANCLSAASTARAAGKPTPPGEGSESLSRNALKRCEPLPDADRTACEARVKGFGTQTGSVASGGILRELVVREVGTSPPPPADATPAAAPASPPSAP